jgi:ketosteroid isomerase-like protein
MTTRTRLSILIPCGLFLLLTGCSAPPPPAPEPVDMTAITAEIQAMEDAYAKSSAAKDADGVVAYYADDVVSYSKETEPMVGKAALRQILADRMAKDTIGATPSFKVQEIFMGTDHLTEIGSWTDTDAAGTVVDHGTYFSIFKKNGDKWQCIRDISVSAKPKEVAAPVVAAQ